MRRFLIACLLLAFAPPCTTAQTAQRGEYPFVAEAIRDYCFGKPPGADGRLPHVLEAHPASPCSRLEVRVLRATVLTGGTMQFQLRCGSAGRLPFLAVAQVGSCPNVRAAKKAVTPLLLRKGQRTRLTLVNSNFRLSLPVVCLQAGRAGDRIRVRATDDRRIFTALVTAGGQLVMELPQ